MKLLPPEHDPQYARSLATFFTLNMEAAGCSEILVTTYHTVQRHIPQSMPVGHSRIFHTKLIIFQASHSLQQDSSAGSPDSR
jgi:hypothetical protein